MSFFRGLQNYSFYGITTLAGGYIGAMMALGDGCDIKDPDWTGLALAACFNGDCNKWYSDNYYLEMVYGHSIKKSCIYPLTGACALFFVAAAIAGIAEKLEWRFTR